MSDYRQAVRTLIEYLHSKNIIWFEEYDEGLITVTWGGKQGRYVCYLHEDTSIFFVKFYNGEILHTERFTINQMLYIKNLDLIFGD